MNSKYEAGCDFCEAEANSFVDAPLGERIFATDHWRVVAARSALPGWLTLIPRRHLESLDELTDEEAAELGPLLRDATQALVLALGARKSYVMQFAEGVRHAHFHIPPRMPDQPEDRRGDKVLGYQRFDTPLSDEVREQVAARIVTAWPRSLDSKEAS